MLDRFLKNMSIESQGALSLTLGLILILGTLGKLQILQSILNSIMIFTGIILVIWGIRATHGIKRIRECLHPKQD